MSGNQRHLDYCFKLIIIGDSGTGKSCILRRYLESQYYEDQTHTIGVEFGAKILFLNGKNIKLQIWDTAGQERYRSVVKSYYRDAIGAIVVYDITNEQSFLNTKRWIEEAKSLSSDQMTCILVGNKKDKIEHQQEQERKVSFLQGSQLAHSLNSMFFETSAVSGENIDEIFTKLTKSILLKLESDELNLSTKQSIIVNTNVNNQKNSITTDLNGDGNGENNGSYLSYCGC
ncbi:hypothetical protein ABK040_003711 [Willaertia magna]